MVKQSIRIGLATTTVITDPYWLRMDIKEDEVDDGMTVAEAARLIDATYNIKACEQQSDTEIWSQGEGANNATDIWSQVEDTTGIDQDTLDAQRRFADSLTTLGYTENCGPGSALDDLLAYTVTIQIYRSHQLELYKLQAVNGVPRDASRHSERTVVTVDVVDKSYITLDKPIVSKVGVRPPVIAWQGATATPKINIIGNTLQWEGSVTGTIRAEFYTEWDEVDVHVTGDPHDSQMIVGTDQTPYGTGWYSGTETGEEISHNQNIPCSVMAFYHFQYEELLLNAPEKDESTTELDKANFCHFITRMGQDDPHIADPEEEEPEKLCNQFIDEKIICECNGKEESNDHYEPVECPPGVSDGSTLRGSIKRTKYKDCGYRDEVNDPAFYEETCCEPWPWPLGSYNARPMPHCKAITKAFMNKPPEEDEEPLEEQYPEGTKIVSVAPADGHCGEWVIKQRVNALDCCDEVPDLWYDEINSASSIAPSSTAVIVAGGSDGREITWTIRGSGFFFTNGLTEIVTNGNTATVVTNAEACGQADIHIADGCSSDNGFIRCTEGRWELVPQEEWPAPGAATNVIATGVVQTQVYWVQALQNKYRITQNFHHDSCRQSVGMADWDYETACSKIPLSISELQSDWKSANPHEYSLYVDDQSAASNLLDDQVFGVLCTPNFGDDEAIFAEDGMFCLEEKRYYAEQPHYRCTNQVSGLVALSAVTVEKWVC